MKDHTIHTFPNGIRLVYKQVSDTRISHCGYTIDAGSRDEEEGKTGLAHFIEHMLFKGTKKRKYQQVLNRLEVVGGDLNAYTTKDKTCIYASIVDSHTERAIELLTDITFFSVFPGDEMKKEKKVIAEEITMYEDSPEEAIFEEFQSALYPGHPLGFPILGTKEHLAAFRQNDLFEFQKENYATGRIVFSYSGRLPLKRVIQMLEKYLSPVPERNISRRRRSFKGYNVFNTRKKTRHNQTYCMVGNLAYEIKHPQKHVLLLLNNLLGGPGLNSRLNLSIREQHGYAYNVESNYFPFTDTGMFNVFMGLDIKNLDRCITIVNREMKKLRDEKLGSLTLHRYISQFTGQIIMAEESRAGLMLSLGKSLLDQGRIDTLDEVIKKVNNITASQLLAVAEEIFDPNKLSTLVYEPDE